MVKRLAESVIQNEQLRQRGHRQQRLKKQRTIQVLTEIKQLRLKNQQQTQVSHKQRKLLKQTLLKLQKQRNKSRIYFLYRFQRHEWNYHFFQ